MAMFCKGFAIPVGAGLVTWGIVSKTDVESPVASGIGAAVVAVVAEGCSELYNYCTTPKIVNEEKVQELIVQSQNLKSNQNV